MTQPAALTNLIQYLPRIGVSLLIFLGFWIASRIAFTIITRTTSRINANRRQAIAFLALLARSGILLFGLLTALGTSGVNVSALVAGLGLTSFGLSFAFKDSIANLLAGVLVLFYQPFKINQVITVSGFEGRVKKIDLRYVTLQADDRTILIPNQNIFSNPVSILDK